MRRRAGLMVAISLIATLITAPTTPVAAAEVEMLGAHGCSQTHGAMLGYQEIGGTKAWTDTQGLGGGDLATWAANGNNLWSKWDSMIAANPGTTDIWWNICLKSRSGVDPDPLASDYTDLEYVYNQIRDRFPTARLWISPINGFDPENCSLSGESADIVAAKLSDWAVGQGWAQRGFDPIDLTPAMTEADNCHPNATGRAALGQQIADFFFSGDLPNAYAGTFSDDDGNVHEGMIEAIAAAGITTGCSTTDPTLYCPYANVTRGQMATFIARALDLPATTTDYFGDDDGTTHEDNINRVAEAGIALGTAPGVYEPSGSVTRGQMASFLARAYDLPATTTDYFGDDDGTTHEDNINRVAEAGIALGVATGVYDPFGTVTRGQMASFLGRAEGLTEITPA